MTSILVLKGAREEKRKPTAESVWSPLSTWHEKCFKCTWLCGWIIDVLMMSLPKNNKIISSFTVVKSVVTIQYVIKIYAVFLFHKTMKLQPPSALEMHWLSLGTPQIGPWHPARTLLHPKDGKRPCKTELLFTHMSTAYFWRCTDMGLTHNMQNFATQRPTRNFFHKHK